MGVWNEKENSTKSAFDAIVEVTITSNKMIAHIRLTSPPQDGEPITMVALHDALQKAGVVFGIREDVLEQIVASPRYHKPEVVAEGQPPIAGINGRIEYHFLVTREKRPKELPDGSMDFKQLGDVSNVRAGDVLCTKIPPTLGRSGFCVDGTELQPKMGKSVELPIGLNTEVSEDGLTLISTRDGQADLVGNHVNVLDVLEIAGDVNDSTGDIDFDGNVVVKGSVTSGFGVKAQGNVTVMGMVEGGFITAGGNVFIESGFEGMGKGKIKTGGDLRCKTIYNGEVSAEFSVETETCVTSKVSAGGNIRILSSQTQVLSSFLMARHTIECYDVGSASNDSDTTLEVGSNPHLMERYINIPKEQENIQGVLANLERVINIFQHLNTISRLEDKKQQELAKLIETRKTQQELLIQLHFERQEVEQQMMTAGYGIIRSLGTIYPRTRIIIGPERLLVQKPYQFTLFSRSKDGVTISSTQ